MHIHLPATPCGPLGKGDEMSRITSTYSMGATGVAQLARRPGAVSKRDIRGKRKFGGPIDGKTKWDIREHFGNADQ